MDIQQQQQQHNSIVLRAITFNLSDQIYALNIMYIRDIVIGKKLYRIPNSNINLVGVTNIRGEILPVYSLKSILSIQDDKDFSQHPVEIDFDDDQYLMIIKYENYLFAVMVDYIDKNISVTPENYSEGKYMSRWANDNIFSGVIIDNTDNILLIDVPSLISAVTK